MRQSEVLQKLLGHASIKTTMDRYVHVTDDSLFAAVHQFEGNKTTVQIGAQQKNWCGIGAEGISEIPKTIENKGELRLYETWYRRPP